MFVMKLYIVLSHFLGRKKQKKTVIFIFESLLLYRYDAMCWDFLSDKSHVFAAFSI